MDILSAESNYSQWINTSIILLTVALIFYHMSKVQSIKLPTFASAFISIGLIAVNIVFTINSLIPYITRTKDIKYTNNENIYKNVYVISGIIFILLEVMICYYIIMDSLSI
jgi:hypothetical protein